MVGNAVWGQTNISGSHTTSITPSDGETITLDNANINVGNGYALDMSNATSATLKIVGECTMTAQSGAAPAVYLPLGKTLTIVADEGTNAILRIKGNDNVQTVTDGENKNKPKLGEIIIQNGTVYILGNLRHDEGHPTAQVQGGVAFIDGDLPKKGDNNGGILFGKEGNTWVGNLYQDYTINSNVQADIDGDPNTSDDIYLNLQSHTLTLGDGVVIDTRNDHFVVENGTIQAFTVTYNANPATSGDRTSTPPTNPSYYGTKASIRLEEGITCEGNASSTHEFLGWVKRGETAVHSAITGTITTPDQYEETPRTENINIDAAWATKSLTITVKESEAIVNTEATTLADTPDGTVTYKSVNGTLPSGINLDNNTFTGTPASGTVDSGESKEFSVTVPYSYSLDGTTKDDISTSVKIIVVKNTVTIDENATITFVDEDGNGIFLYDGKEHSQNVKVTVNDVPLTEGVDFTVSYSYTSEDNKTTNQTVSTVKNAGTYIISSIIGKNNATGTITNPKDQSGNPLKVVVTPRKLKFQAVSRSISLDETASFALTPTYYDQTNNPTGTIRLLTGTSVDGFAEGEAPASPNWGSIFSGTLEIQSSPITTVGTYTLLANGKVNITDATPFLTNNYTAEFTDDGKLTVTDTLDDDDVETEIDNNDGEDAAEFENGTITLTYDGLSHAITSVKKKGNETALNADTDYEISYTYKATADAEAIDIDLEEGDEVKDAGTYTATISFKGNYSESNNVTRTIIINKRPLTITAINQTIYAGTTEEGKQTEVNKTPTFGQAEGNTLTVSNIVSIEETAENVTFSTGELGLSEVVSAAISAETPGKYEDAITQGSLALADNNDVNTNYTISTDEGATFTPGDLTIIRVLSNDDQDDMIGGDDGEDEDGNFTGDNDYILVGDVADVTYSGQPYELKDLYWEADGKKTKVTIAEVTYAVDSEVENNTAAALNDDEKAVDAGHYTATVKVTSSTEEGSENYFETSDSESLVFKFEIKQASLTVTGSYECEETPTTVSTSDVTDLEATGLVNNEQVSFSGNLKVENNNLVPNTDFKLEAAANTAFKETNYNISYNITLTVTGEGGEEDDKTELDPNGDDKDNTTGGEEGEDDEFPSDDDFILLSPNAETSNSVYDGQEHGLTILKIGEYTLREETDYNVIETYTPTNANQANVGSNGLPKHVNTYSAEITLVEGSGYKWPDNAESYTLTGMTINERPMLISFVSEVASEADLRDINKLVQYEPMAGDRGLVLYEQPIVEATISDVTELGNGRYRVTIDRESFTISNNEGNFYLSDYTIALDADGDDSGDYNVTDEDNDGTGGLDDGDGSGDGDITIDVTIDPNKPNFPDFGGGGIHKPIEYYNIYIDTVCPGIKLELSRDVVKGGNEVSVYLTIQSECDTTGMRFEYKRGLFGIWKDLKELEGVQPGGYIIKNIYTDIYIRALDATMPDDATGLEEVEGVKAYAQDGSIYVYTPNRMPVWIVSMTGAVLRNEEQVGLQAYDRLTRGIYIVRVGEQVFKIRL